MLKSHEKFHSANGKRTILVVDDEMINRELLRNVLEGEYEVLTAENGQQGLRTVQEHNDTLSLVLLDLMMPVMSGTEMLRCMKENADTAQIPVIVLTSDQTAEVESLNLGAIDFIPKPYPQAGVILARIRRTIELSEDRDIIRSTERDPLTGLYNREYFYRYAEQFDQFHKEMDMDAIVVDIFHFHLINERFGTAYGDSILRQVGEKAREVVQASGGIVCRREADTFLVYCPHRTDYEEILLNASIALGEGQGKENRVRLRMGVYSNVDKSIDIERRFDRAKAAADTVRASVTKTIAIYDNALHEKELYEEQLVEDFHRAIREEQFQVYYQPKFDVRPEIPELSSAEALIRWLHPQLGMISPGVFIPLFEENGLIQELDTYVWEHAAAQIQDWKRRFRFVVPVSVNVSRIDMYDPNLIDTLQRILREHELTPGEFLLEITESAYTQDSAQIIQTVHRLRDLGFQIEMDDFGTGYSSLNMISTLPIDALKLDMQFIRNAFSQRKDTRMLEVIIDIADYLSVPVIAEGVETEEQLTALKAMGCDIVQGYYFSKPIPAAKYEHFVVERMRRDSAIRESGPALRRRAAKNRAKQDMAIGGIAHALSSGFESIYYVDISNDHYVEFSSQGQYNDLQIQRSGSDFFTDTQNNIPRVVFAEDQARVSLSLQKETLLAQLMGNQPFTMTYRLVINGRPLYYHLKAIRTAVRDHHIVIGVSNVDAEMRRQKESITYSSIAQALANDYFSIYYVDTNTDRFVEYSSHEDFQDLSIEKGGEDFFARVRADALRMIYPEDQEMVMTALKKETLMATLEANGIFTLTYRLILDGKPTYVHMKASRMADKDDPHIVIGVSSIDAQIRREQEQERELAQARELANRDPLTGVKSKHAFVEAEAQWNEKLRENKADPFAVAYCDLNGLKQVNDTMGHNAGDLFIQRACSIICNIFKHSPVYRVGGDEFVAILSGQDYQHRETLLNAFADMNREHSQSQEVIIACGLSSYRPGSDRVFEDVLKRADERMYENKAALKVER
ncbi:MAG: EAL domain-containing protein [Clostridia bacterium]|nr:EAL domain-containing protein [Clostridia bacterium]